MMTPNNTSGSRPDARRSFTPRPGDLHAPPRPSARPGSRVPRPPSRPPRAPGERVRLSTVGKGQVPPDTGMDDKTKPEIVEDFKELGGGKALKVPFAPGDSFGARISGASANWKRFARFRFDVFNPS